MNQRLPKGLPLLPQLLPQISPQPATGAPAPQRSFAPMLRVLSSRKRVAATRSIITGPRFTSVVKNLASIVPFVAPEEMERTREKPFKVRLGANEMTLGPSPKAVAAMQAAAADAWMYGVSVPTPARTPLENGPRLSFAPAD